MDNRKFQAGAAASAPTPPASPSSGFPTNGGPSIAPTTPGDWWFHQIGEEIRAVITASGLTPSHTTLNQLLTAIKLGFGQAWQNMLGSRSLGVTYTNTAGYPIFVAVTISSVFSNYGVLCTINGTITIDGPGITSTGARTGAMFLIPPGATYLVFVNNGTPTLHSWNEYR